MIFPETTTRGELVTWLNHAKGAINDLERDSFGISSRIKIRETKDGYAIACINAQDYNLIANKMLPRFNHTIRQVRERNEGTQKKVETSYEISLFERYVMEPFKEEKKPIKPLTEYEKSLMERYGSQHTLSID